MASPRRRVVTVQRCLEHGRPACQACARRLSQVREEQAPRAPLTQALGLKLARHLKALTSPPRRPRRA